MKSATHLATTDSRTTVQPKTKPSEFLSPAETRALTANSATFRQQRLQAGDMISTDDAAALTGTSRVTINAWIAKGQAIGLSQAKRGFRLPQWQFDANFLGLLPKLSQALGTRDGWAMLAFLETPHGGLNGATPRAAIERGDGARVLELAARAI